MNSHMCLNTYPYSYAPIRLWIWLTNLSPNLCGCMCIYTCIPPVGPAHPATDVQTDVHFAPVDSVCS